MPPPPRAVMGAGLTAASRLGLGVGGKLAAGAAGEVVGLTGTNALLGGKWPSAADFQDNATVILGLRSLGKAGAMAKKGVTSEAMTARLQEIFKESGITPDQIAIMARNDKPTAAYLKDPFSQLPQKILDAVQKNVIYEDARSLKITFVETGKQPSASIRPELKEYLQSFKGEDVLALKYTDPAQYLETLRSIVRKFFPKEGELQFRSENGMRDYGHLLKDEQRTMFIHTLPRTLKDHSIKVEFKTPEGKAKAYLIKKYFDQNIQKDIWDILVFHERELRTKIARSRKGQAYIESIILQAGKE